MMGGRKRGLQMQAGGMCYFVAAISFVPALHCTLVWERRRILCSIHESGVHCNLQCMGMMAVACWVDMPAASRSIYLYYMEAGMHAAQDQEAWPAQSLFISGN